jgi:6-phosphogluconate dehydrogenase (decarboxylating)
VVGYNRSPDPTNRLMKEGLQPAFALKELASKLETRRIVMLYVPHGKPTDEVIKD